MLVMFIAPSTHAYSFHTRTHTLAYYFPPQFSLSCFEEEYFVEDVPALLLLLLL